ncbi:MAG: hypothetical protein Q4E91_01925 [Lachnospiraceae bacterium]|nr:hypothetical protein [Lachnospiraceae bacterium]
MEASIPFTAAIAAIGESGRRYPAETDRYGLAGRESAGGMKRRMQEEME